MGLASAEDGPGGRARPAHPGSPLRTAVPRRARARTLPLALAPGTARALGGVSSAGGPLGPSAGFRSTGLEAPPTAPAALAEPAANPPPPSEKTPQKARRGHWLDVTQNVIYESVWHSAMWLDRKFGSREPDVAYEQVSGSVAPGALYDGHYGITKLLRFHADVPLPQLDERFHAFVARVNPSEFISESQAPSGALANPYGLTSQQDQTLLGLQFFDPRQQGGHWAAGAGVRLTWPPDPYVKGGYEFDYGKPQENGVLRWTETGYYQNTQGGVGITSRIDYERIVNEQLLINWTLSSSIAQRTAGFLNYSTLDLIRVFPTRKAIGLELSIDGATRAPVKLHNPAIKLAYRRAVFRPWLVMELRTGVDWPKDYPYQRRKAEPQVGLAFEMFFGTVEFLARPITF